MKKYDEEWAEKLIKAKTYVELAEELRMIDFVHNQGTITWLQRKAGSLLDELEADE